MRDAHGAPPGKNLSKSVPRNRDHSTPEKTRPVTYTPQAQSAKNRHTPAEHPGTTGHLGFIPTGNIHLEQRLFPPSVGSSHFSVFSPSQPIVSLNPDCHLLGKSEPHFVTKSGGGAVIPFSPAEPCPDSTIFPHSQPSFACASASSGTRHTEAGFPAPGPYAASAPQESQRSFCGHCFLPCHRKAPRSTLIIIRWPKTLGFGHCYLFNKCVLNRHIRSGLC